MENASEDGREARDLPVPPVLAARFPALTQGSDETPVLRFPQQVLLALPRRRVVSVPDVHTVASCKRSVGVLADHDLCSGRWGGEASAEGWNAGWRWFARTARGVRAYVAWLEETQLLRAGYRLGAAASIQLAVEAVDVRLDGAHRDEEPGCDLLV